EVEAQPHAMRLGLALLARAVDVRPAGAVVPDAAPGEGLVELHAEPGGVLGAAAEAAGDDPALDAAVAHHLHFAADHGMALIGLAEVEQHVAGLRSRRIGIAFGGGAGECSRLRSNAAIAGQL